MDMQNIQNVHLIGIGGIGMSALARLFLHEGKKVSGSDQVSSDITDALVKEGVTFFDVQQKENITDNIDLVVYTEAMAKDHPEMVAARALNVPVMNYFTALGEMLNEYHLIAVAGTHGKTTTTAMLADIFEVAEKDPTVIVGSLRMQTASNFRAGKSKYAIVEACEYKRDFLTLEPNVLVITNIEFEHTDYYKDLADVQDAFHTFAMKVPADGRIVCDTTDPALAPVIDGVKATVVDYRAYIDPLLKLKQPGIHNVKNAAAAIAAAAGEDIDPSLAKEILESFAGTWRRFEYKGELGGAPVYDDYGHHPTEIRATLESVKTLYPHKRIVLAFQPHTFSRTKELLADFVTVLKEADQVLLAPIYAAREKDDGSVSSAILAKQINGAEAFETLEALKEHLQTSVTADDVVVVMGAGDITHVANMLV